jgi:hypothetical protein
MFPVSMYPKCMHLHYVGEDILQRNHKVLGAPFDNDDFFTNILKLVLLQSSLHRLQSINV